MSELEKILVGNGEVVSDGSTGHYYIFVEEAGISWDEAKVRAEAYSFNGLKTISAIRIPLVAMIR